VYTIPSGSILHKAEGEVVDKSEIFVKWDPYTIPILSDVSGIVKYEDLKEGVTMTQEKDATTGLIERVVIEHKEDLHPQILICNKEGDVLGFYPIPANAHVVVKDGQKTMSGSLIAKTPRKLAKTKDITGGLPRVAELFEARKPKNPSIISEIDGTVEFGDVTRGQRKIIVTSSTGMEKEYVIPHGKHLNVYKGDTVHAGEQLVDGPVVPQDILAVGGERKLQEYLVQEVQAVYRLQGVTINDKHIEAIVRQMLRKVRIDDSGDTDLLIGSQVDKGVFKEANKVALAKKKKPAIAAPILLGITKASLTTESFISAASFQETTRVLTEAASAGKKDELLGLKENVIMGHLVPAGTGFRVHHTFDMKVAGPLQEAFDKMKEAQAEEAAAALEAEVIED